MKKIILLFALLLSFCAIAQNFPGEKIELLKDKTLKVLPKEESLQKYGYRDIYTDSDLKKVYKKSGTSTSYSALAGKEFRVISFEPYKNIVGVSKYKLLIENPETGKLYFDYDPKYSHTFPFEVIGGLDYPKGFFCDKIYEKNVEGESDDRWYEVSMEDGVQVTKAKGKFTFIFLTINSPISETYDPKILKRGVIVTFDNGETLSLPNEKLTSKRSPAGTNAVLTASFSIDKEKFDLIKEHKIKSVKLDKFERDVTSGSMIREYIKCMLKD